MTRTSIIFLLFFGLAGLRAQDPEYLEFVKAEARLQGMFNQLYSDTLSDSDSLLLHIREEMSNVLAMEGSMDFPWSRLTRIGVVSSDDKRLRIFSWHVMDDYDHYRYFGFIQVGMKKGNVRVHELIDNGKPQRGLMKLEQSDTDWYGKLYYGVVTSQHKRKIFYTLLGMDFNDARSNIKSVEVISLQRHQPRFEGSLFFNGRDFVDRLLLEYADQVTISVRYDPSKGMITYDHLVPFHPIYHNNYEFYGPDGSYDGLEFSDGRWNYREDIDARNID
jgi:hypothetical protein